MSKVLCFGEMLLRYSPELEGRWIAQNQMQVYLGGAELNTATALAKWNVPVKYCTAVPDNYLSRELVEAVRGRGIEEAVVFSGNRIGSFFLPVGADMKHAGVIYDRAHSSFSELMPGQIDWDEKLQDVTWFHFSAIDPAVSQQAAAVCEEVLKIASAKNITISVDLNYRAKLWQYGKQPVEVMPALVEYCDVVMGNIWAEEKMLGIELPADLPDDKDALLEQSQRSAEAIMSRFEKSRLVANTFRFDGDERVKYYASLYDGKQLYVSKEFRTDHIVDKVGSGDTFMAGLIYGGINQLASEDTINFAAAAAFNKLFIKGDATTATVEQIRKGDYNYA